MLDDYEEISAGDVAKFRQSNNGVPPVQVEQGHCWGSVCVGHRWGFMLHAGATQSENPQ